MLSCQFLSYNKIMIINFYKKRGISSFSALYGIKKALGTKKVGHCGTLDPFAEGVLLVVTGEDTKKSQELTHLNKEYISEIVFGIKSATFDFDSKNIAYSKNPISLGLVAQFFPLFKEKFIGKIVQQVPSYSAVKINGKKLYKHSREGNIDNIKLPSREVEIYEFEILDSYEKEIMETKYPVMKVRIMCSSGTYIRSIAVDIGKLINSDSILYSLVRTKIGGYTIEDSIKDEDIFKITQ